MPKRQGVKASEYHLIDIVSGESHGGFIDLIAARDEAYGIGLLAWQIFHGDVRVEHHDPDGVATQAIEHVVLPIEYTCK